MSSASVDLRANEVPVRQIFSCNQQVHNVVKDFNLFSWHCQYIDLQIAPKISPVNDGDFTGGIKYNHKVATFHT